MSQSLLQQGLDLMIYGMGTVFLFLTLLVFGMSMMSSLVTRFFAEESVPETSAADIPSLSREPVPSKTLAVIQQAVTLHRSKQKK